MAAKNYSISNLTAPESSLEMFRIVPEFINLWLIIIIWIIGWILLSAIATVGILKFGNKKT